jgi:hypothetical protein
VVQGEFGGGGGSDEAAFGVRLRQFSRDGYVFWSKDGGRAEVFVGSTLIGVFERRDPRARDLILIGLCQGRRVRLGRLAEAFDISGETLRKARRLYEREGLAGLVGGKPRGRAPKLEGAAVRAVHRWFAQGVSVREVQEKLRARKVPVSVSVGTLSNERARWKAAQLTRDDAGAATVEEAPPSEPPEGTQFALPGRVAPELALPELAEVSPTSAVDAAGPDPADEERAQGGIEETCTATDVSGEAPQALGAEAAPSTAPAAADEDNGATVLIEGVSPQGGRFVQHLGAWLMLAMLWTMGLHARFEKERSREGRTGRQPRAATVRVALDALIVALAVGQRCIEGVRRLQTSTAAKLLRASEAPTASWVRRVLGLLAAQDGAARIALATAGAHVQAAQAATYVEAPVVFYLDNHLRPYTGKHVVRKGWRMQDRRVRPGITDCYVHDQYGNPVFRIDSPGHESLTSLTPRATKLLRLALGPEERILVAFDRGGAFPTQLAELRDEGFDFVTYERRPYAKLPKTAFTETLVFSKNDVVTWCEAADKNLGSGRGRVRRIAVRDSDGRQINLIAISEAPAEWLIEIMPRRWRQENSFKHGVERWGQNQLDSRKVQPCDPETILPNPARRRLDRDLRLARTREGEALRQLALLGPAAPRRAAHERDLAQARATQATLLALRARTPTYAPLHETDLADKLVAHRPDFKLLVDAVRAACYNAESDLAARLAPYLKLPDEAKKLLANVFASPGELRVHATGITVVLDCAANRSEHTAIAALLAEITAAKLTLPGDPAQRLLTFRAQPFDR